MKSTIRVCVVYSRDLAGMPRVTHGSVNCREPQPGREYPQTAKTAINGRRVNLISNVFIMQNHFLLQLEAKNLSSFFGFLSELPHPLDLHADNLYLGA